MKPLSSLENTEVKYRLTDDFFEEQSFDSADLLEDQGKDILVDSYTPLTRT